jgi:sulfur relay (sulfurtransferase) DsrF/TusC family protein
MKMAVVVTITQPPFGHENAFAGLYVGSASLSKGLEVVVLLMGDGVYNARKGQVDPLKNIFMPPTENQVQDIIDMGGRVIIEKEALWERGIEPSELLEGIEVMESSRMMDIIIENGEKVVGF